MKFNIKKALLFSLTMRYLLIFSMIFMFECEAAPLLDSSYGDYISCSGVKCVCNGRWKRSLRIQSCCTCLGSSKVSDERKKRKWSIEDDKSGEVESQPYKDGPKKVVYDTSDGSYLSYESDELSSFGSESEEEYEKILVDSKQLGIEDKDIEVDQNKENAKKRHETAVDTKKNSIGSKEKDLSYESNESFDYESDEKEEKVLVDNKPLDIEDNVKEIDKKKGNTQEIEEITYVNTKTKPSGHKDTDIEMMGNSNEKEGISEIDSSEILNEFKDGEQYYESGDKEEKALVDSSPMKRNKKKEKNEMTTVDVESEENSVLERVEITSDSTEDRSVEKEDNSNERKGKSFEHTVKPRRYKKERRNGKDNESIDKEESTNRLSQG